MAYVEINKLKVGHIYHASTMEGEPPEEYLVHPVGRVSAVIDGDFRKYVNRLWKPKLVREGELFPRAYKKYSEDLALEKMREWNRSDPMDTIAKFMLVLRYKGDKHVYPVGMTGPCHYSLKNIEKGASILAMANCVNTRSWGARPGPEFNAWWDYLVHESPWAPVFMTKDLDAAMTSGHLINTMLPSNFVVQALIQSRQGQEYPYKLKYWYEGVKAGCDPLFAMLLAEMYRPKARDLVGFRQGGENHDAFDPGQMGPEVIRNFLGGVQVNPKVRLRHCGDYYGIFELYGSGDSIVYPTVTRMQEGMEEAEEEYMDYAERKRVKRVVPVLTDKSVGRHMFLVERKLREVIYA